MFEQIKEDSVEKFINIGQVSKIIGVNVQTVRRWDKENKIRSIRTPGGHRRYRLSDIEKLINMEEKQ